MEPAVEALVVGVNDYMIWPLPRLLARAGFAVDSVEVSGVLRHSRFVRHAHRVNHIKNIPAFADDLNRKRPRPYDLVVIADDPTLTAFVEREQQGTQSGLLPVIAGSSHAHLHSKIGLSRRLSECGVQTPRFGVARCRDEAATIAGALGYPVFVKRDAGSGGHGVYKCNDAGAIAALNVFDQPVLIQKAIAGAEHRVSAAFFDAQLVHFDYADAVRSLANFGPTIVRTYYPSALVDPAVFGELGALARALGAHGFANISLIDAADGSGRYYFECDMRPNAWADFAPYFGEDPADRIRAWFAERTPLTREAAVATSNRKAPLTIPHFLRLSFFELATNYRGVWRYVPLEDAPLIRALLLGRIIDLFYRSGARDLVPEPVRRGLKRAYKAVRGPSR
jgi:hypothetical protein